jgi:hypothetical protein
MIHLLASLFRGAHFILGITAPPPGHNERTFVLIWLGVIGAVLLLFGGLLYFIPYFYVHH